MGELKKTVCPGGLPGADLKIKRELLHFQISTSLSRMCGIKFCRTSQPIHERQKSHLEK
jgi:hypothetical protein